MMKSPLSLWERAGVRVVLLLAVALCTDAAAATPQLKSEARARLSSIEQYLDDWDVAAARRELTALEQLVPADIEPLKYFQGRVAFEEGKYDEAVALLEGAQVEDKPGSYLRLARDTRAIVKEHERAESEHFILLYPKGKDSVLVPYALETLESIHKALKDDLGYAPPGKVRVEVVNSARDLARVSTLTLKQIQTTGTIAICKFNKLMVTSPKAVARGYDWQDTLAHEYVHLVVSQMSHNTVPIWLHEGLAKYLESRWRGKAGLALTPSTLALLGRRVKSNTLVPFEKMHPSIAMLPTAEDAATAFAEVFYAVDYLHAQKGTAGLRALVAALKGGQTDKKAVETAMGVPFAQFEKRWLAHIKAQPFPKELLPREQVVLKEEGKADEKKQKGREISFGDFAEVTEVAARQFAHLGELMRERSRVKAASEELSRAHAIVGDKYESVSNKYALTLLELRRLDEAERVLRGSLRVHPGSPQTNVHLGRILLFRKDYPKARTAYLEALAADPFDPEIHLALTRIHSALGHTDLAQRTRLASATLTGLKPEEVDRVAQELLREEGSLSGMEVPGTETRKAPPPPQPAGKGGKEDADAQGLQRPDAGR